MTVEAGCPLSVLSTELLARGLALANRVTSLSRPSRAPSRPAPTAAAVTWEARRDWRISFPVEVRVLGP